MITTTLRISQQINPLLSPISKTISIKAIPLALRNTEALRDLHSEIQLKNSNSNPCKISKKSLCSIWQLRQRKPTVNYV